jgi:hypothetical protein
MVLRWRIDRRRPGPPLKSWAAIRGREYSAVLPRHPRKNPDPEPPLIPGHRGRLDTVEAGQPMNEAIEVMIPPATGRLLLLLIGVQLHPPRMRGHVPRAVNQSGGWHKVSVPRGKLTPGREHQTSALREPRSPCSRCARGPSVRVVRFTVHARDTWAAIEATKESAVVPASATRSLTGLHPAAQLILRAVFAAPDPVAATAPPARAARHSLT